MPIIILTHMIKAKGKFKKVAGHLFVDDLQKQLVGLPDNGEYFYLVYDQEKNRNLPYLQYLHGVVLKFISDSLPGHPGTMALYKFFERMFSPVHTVKFDDQEFSYQDLKTEKSADVNDVIERIVEYALKEWGIEVPAKTLVNTPELKEEHARVYANQEADWSSFISSRNQSKDERRNQKTERI